MADGARRPAAEADDPTPAGTPRDVMGVFEAGGEETPRPPFFSRASELPNATDDG